MSDSERASALSGAARTVHPRARKRKRYLEPGQPCAVPRTTLLYQERMQQSGCSTSADSDRHQSQSTQDISPQREFSYGDTSSGPEMAENKSSADDPNINAGGSSAGMGELSCVFECSDVDACDDDSAEECGSHADPFSSSSNNCNDVEGGDGGENTGQCDAEEFCRMFSDERLPSSDLSVRDAMVILMSYSTSVGLNWADMEKLASVINLLLGKQVLPTSQYTMRKVWKRWKEDIITHHYYCQQCGKIIPNEDRATKFTCPFCKAANTSSNLFATLSVKRQIEAHLSDRNVARALLTSLKERKTERHTPPNSSTLRDITDGRLYKQQMEDASWSDVSLTFNTDGARVFKSSKSTLWPIQAVVNELPVALRWSNVLLCGLYFGRSHPKMKSFLQVFADAITEPQTVNWECDGQKFSSKLRIICCCVDAPARAAALNMKQFNGYYGCSYCHHKGARVGRSVKYPVIISGKEPSARTDSSVRRSMTVAESTGQLHRGFKGISPLACLPNFDLVWSVCPDYMHCVLEGVGKQLAEAWFGRASCPAYIGEPAIVRQVNIRLLSMKPPQWVTRLPRAIEDRSLWKASEWKWWLLFYAVPCLDGILAEPYYEHFCLLVAAVYLLLKDSIAKSDVVLAADKISAFVFRMKELYSEAAMTFNVHQLLHIPKSVMELGPLWSHSTFVFESGNGTLLRLITDANGVPLQILERFVMKLQATKLSSSLNLAAPVRALCKQLVAPAVAQHSTEPVFLGKGIIGTALEEDEQVVCFEKLGYVPSSVTSYQRVEIHKQRLHVIGYERAKKTKNCLFTCKGGKHYALLKIHQLPDCSCLLICVHLDHQPHRNVPHIHANTQTSRKAALFPNDVGKVSVSMTVDCKHYIADIPNMYEQD